MYVSTKLHSAQLILPEHSKLPEGISLESPRSPAAPPPIEKDPVRSRSTSSMSSRPPLPPKEARRSRGSTLQLVSNNPDLLAPPNGISKRRPNRKHQHAILNQLASFKHWFIESAKRAKSPASRSESSTLKNSPPSKLSPTEPNRTAASMTPTHSNITPAHQMSSASHPRPRIPTPKNRSSLSPAPITPRSSYRHASGGLRGRKSTSSSVSSIRSIHHVPSHSKASSTSSTSASVHSSVPFSKSSKSPHASVKVLPSTPTVASFPSNVRLVRAVPNYNESAIFTSPNGMLFAKRKRTPFRGPVLSLGVNGSGSPNGRPRESSASASRSASVAGRASGEIIEEEDEDEVEEVDAFSPIAPEAEETIFCSGEEPEDEGWVRRRHE